MKNIPGYTLSVRQGLCGHLRVGHVVPLCHPGGVSTDRNPVQGEGSLKKQIKKTPTRQKLGFGRWRNLAKEIIAQKLWNLV